jgi:hypothetical protein
VADEILSTVYHREQTGQEIKPERNIRDADLALKGNF